MSLALSATFSIFPPNGMDRSLHVAVLIGLALSTFFTEAFGWTYAGLVVPGYLATVFAASPVTGAVVVVEGIVTYLLVALIGRWVTRTGAWSTAFGRERFYLFIVCAVVVRLAMDGWALPALGEHYRFEQAHELYSLGLVLVPLVANAFWNVGLAQALPRVAFLSLLTYLCLALLFRYTNLSVSRFQVINDSLSLKFLQEPKAHLILVIGAFLGARNNVRYGWDYNGILVPGLLAVAWYEPLKLATTAAEALTVYFICATVTSRPPFSRMLIVGPRRTMLAYLVGFVVKLGGSHVLARVAPGLQLIDYFGFGYLLPALIAVKIWNKDNIGVVMMPTLQVSLTAFVIGNALGWGLGQLVPPQPPIAVAPATVTRHKSTPMALMLGDTAPRSSVRVSRSDDRVDSAARDLAAEILANGIPTDTLVSAAAAVGVKVSQSEGDDGFYVIAPFVDEPDATPPAPRAAVRRSEGLGRWIVVVEPRGPGSLLPFVAERLADALGADAIVLVSRDAALRENDVLFAHRIQRLLGSAGTIVVRESDLGSSDTPTLELADRLGALDASALDRALEGPVELHWRGDELVQEPWQDAPRLNVPTSISERVVERSIGAPALEQWSGPLRPELRARIQELTTSAPPYSPPTIEELRLFDLVLVPAMLHANDAPAPWLRAMADQLGYRFARVGPPADPPHAWALAEPGTSRRGWPTWIARAQDAKSTLLVEVPAPRWEMGTIGAGMALWDALEAQSLIISGTLPNLDALGASDPRRWSGRRSFFQRIHERWLGAGRAAVSIQAIAPDRGFSGDAVISYGFEALDRRQSPKWAEPLERYLGEELALEMYVYDGTGSRAPFSGSADPTMAYARRFEPGSYGILYLAGAARVGFDLVISKRDDTLARTLLAHGTNVETSDVAAHARALATCASRDQICWPEPPVNKPCNLDEVAARLTDFADLGYPADLAAARDGRGGCWFEVSRDESTGRLWALAAEPGEVHLVPLASPLTRRSPIIVSGAAELRRIVKGGVSRIVVRGAP